MNPFEYRNGRLCAEAVALDRIGAEVGTPCYVYSRRRIEDNWRAYDRAFGDHPHRICYSVKANGNLAVLQVMARLGSGFDIVSGGELRRVMSAGGDPAAVVFSGVGKTRDEIDAALEAGVACIDVESTGEIDRVSEAAVRLGRAAPLAVRVNPDVDPRTHPYIATGLKTSKFGIAFDDAVQTYEYAARQPGIEIVGVACHIGSQLMDTAPLLDAFERLLDLVDSLRERGIEIRHVDAGGGLGVRGGGGGPEKGALIGAMLEAMGRRRESLPIYIEPGRSIVADAGLLLTRVEYLKSNGGRRFAVVDAGMNDLLRPALYQARHEMLAVSKAGEGQGEDCDVVGPVCESADVLGTERRLAVAPGALVAIMDAGAYGSVMASNYNARPRPAEVMVDGDRFQVVRRRETFEEMVAGERLLD